MARKSAVHNASPKTGKNRGEDNAVGDAADESWEDNHDSSDYEERWLNMAARDKERSRIQRQMKARRELERLRDEKRLRQLVADWPFED